MNSNFDITIDLHQDVVSHMRSTASSQTDFESLYRNVRVFFGSVFQDPTDKTIDPVIQIKKDIRWYRSLASHVQYAFQTIFTKGDFIRMLKGGDRGVMIHLEGADVLTPDTKYLLEEWYTQGLRSIGLLWNQDNALGVAAASLRPHAGLTAFGKDVVRECNRLGILVDCAHLNKAGFYDVLRISKAPPLVTHGNAYSLCPHPRNFTDEQIRDIASCGGIIGAFFSGKYVRQDQPPSIEDAVKHILHMISVAGIDTVAVGSDFGGITSGIVSGLAHVNDLSALRALLQTRNLSQVEINKVFGANAACYLKTYL